jgi:hypothetical protein
MFRDRFVTHYSLTADNSHCFGHDRHRQLGAEIFRDCVETMLQLNILLST